MSWRWSASLYTTRLGPHAAASPGGHPGYAAAAASNSLALAAALASPALRYNGPCASQTAPHAFADMHVYSS